MKNILIRPTNEKKGINFCKEKIDWTIEIWENSFSNDAMVVIGTIRLTFTYGEEGTQNMLHI